MNEKCMVLEQEQPAVEKTGHPNSGVRSERAQTMLITVDSFDNDLARGTLHTFSCQKVRAFSSLDQLLFAMDEALEQSNLSQTAPPLRREILPPLPGEPCESNAGSGDKEPEPCVQTYAQATLKAKHGQMANFYVRILCRDHASIQGVLMWHEMETKTAFRSELELLLLLRSALNRATHNG